MTEIISEVAQVGLSLTPKDTERALRIAQRIIGGSYIFRLRMFRVKQNGSNFDMEIQVEEREQNVAIH